MNLKLFKNLITCSKNIILISHKMPDRDTISSALVLYEAFQNSKSVKLLCADNVPNKYNDLLDVSLFDHIVNIDLFLNNIESEIDLIIVLDTRDEAQLGTAASILRHFRMKNVPIINIDHHKQNSEFGSLNLIDTHAASTTEILARIFEKVDLPITPRIAQLMLIGITSDTLGFRSPETTSDTLLIASKLIKIGADRYEIMKSILSNHTVEMLKEWGEVLTDLKIYHDYKLAICIVNHQRFKKSSYGHKGYTELINFIRDSSNIDIAVLLIQREPNIIDISLRSTDKFNCARLARNFPGGGGHFASAGFTLKNFDLINAEKILVNSISEQYGLNENFGDQIL